MLKILTSALIGVALGVGGTLAVQKISQRPPKPIQQEQYLLSSAPHFFEEFIPGAKVLDVSVQSPSEHTVNYVYEALYDVHLSYRLGNDVKKVSLPFGFSGGTPIMPSQTDFVIANDQATVVKRLSGSEVQHPLGIYLASPTKGDGLIEVSDSLEQKFFIHNAPDLDEHAVSSVEYAVRDLPSIKRVFTKAGAQRYHDLTRRSVGKPLVFMSSGKVLMAPIIEGVSNDSFVWITTAQTEEQTKALYSSLSRALALNK